MKVITSKTLKIWTVNGKVTIAKCLLTGKFVSHIVAKSVLSAVNLISDMKPSEKLLWAIQDMKAELACIKDFYADKIENNEYDHLSEKKYFSYEKACFLFSDEVRYIYSIVV